MKNSIFLTVVLADQLSKFFICHFLPRGEKVSFISRYLEICHAENSGIIFGFGSSWGQNHDHFMAIGLLGIAGLTIILMWKYKKEAKNQLALILPLFIGGSVSNLIDRLTKGKVIDWINSSLITGPINIADIAIMSAISFFAIQIFKGGFENAHQEF